MRVKKVKETTNAILYDVEDKGKTFRVMYVPETSTGKQHWVTCNCPVWLAGIGVLPKHEKKPRRKITTSFHLVCSHGWRVLQCQRVINVNGKHKLTANEAFVRAEQALELAKRIDAEEITKGRKKVIRFVDANSLDIHATNGTAKKIQRAMGFNPTAMLVEARRRSVNK